MQAVWPDAFVTDDSRVQLASSYVAHWMIAVQQLLKTVPRRGYLV
jgi:DNA-binding winged helix-turn-helix (wHTH) protein